MFDKFYKEILVNKENIVQWDMFISISFNYAHFYQ